MRADDLDFATRQMVELAKALTLEEAARGHLVILLDEPTSVLERAEIDVLFARVRALKVARLLRLRLAPARRGAGALRPRLRDEGRRGRRRARRPPRPTCRRCTSLMVGRGLQAEYYREPLQKPLRDDVVVEAEGLGLGRRLPRRQLQAARRRDPRHRRRDRLGPRGADPHPRRLRAARRRHASTSRAAMSASPRRPRRSTAASATSRASGASRAWCCSCRSPPTSRSPTSAA